MKTKNRFLSRLMAIYFVVLAGSFALEFPDISRDIQTGCAAGQQDFDAKLTHAVMPVTEFLSADLKSVDVPAADTLTKGNMTVEVSYPQAYLKVTMTDGRIGHGLGWSLLLEVLAQLSQLVILILMGVIINSLRRSIRDGKPLQKVNILRTRWIGVLILTAGLLSDFSAFIQNGAAAAMLDGSNIAVNTAFQLTYWNLFMGVLLLFTAEVFAIGHKLGEEQQFTI